MTITEAAREALAVQDACNLSGIVQSWARIMQSVLRVSELGTDAVNHHPINILFASKVASLTGYESDTMAFSRAYDAVIDMATENAFGRIG